MCFGSTTSGRSGLYSLEDSQGSNFFSLVNNLIFLDINLIFPEIVGPCLLTIPLFLSLSPTTPLRECVRKMMGLVAEGEENGYIGLPSILRSLRSTSQDLSLFDSLFIFETSPSSSSPSSSSSTSSSSPLLFNVMDDEEMEVLETTEFSLTATVGEKEGVYTLELLGKEEMKTGLNTEILKKISAAFGVILDEFCTDSLGTSEEESDWEESEEEEELKDVEVGESIEEFLKVVSKRKEIVALKEVYFSYCLSSSSPSLSASTLTPPSAPPSSSPPSPSPSPSSPLLLEITENLSAIFIQLLNLPSDPPLSPHASFFSLSGDSILTIHLISSCRQLGNGYFHLVSSFPHLLTSHQ